MVARGSRITPSEKSFTSAWTRYRLPAQISFVDRLDVPEAKSSRSTHATYQQRNARATTSSGAA